jgi:hypothetical protein
MKESGGMFLVFLLVRIIYYEVEDGRKKMHEENIESNVRIINEQ